MAGLTPAAVICEIMREDGTMARLPELLDFAARHEMRIGTIANLIHYRSSTESLVRRVAERDIETLAGRFHLIAHRDLPSGPWTAAPVSNRVRLNHLCVGFWLIHAETRRDLDR